MSYIGYIYALDKRREAIWIFCGAIIKTKRIVHKLLGGKLTLQYT